MFLLICEIIMLAYCLRNISQGVSTFPTLERGQKGIEKIKESLKRLPVLASPVLTFSILITAFLHVIPPALLLIFCDLCATDVILEPQAIMVILLAISGLIVGLEIKTIVEENKKITKKLLVMNRIDVVIQVIYYTITSGQLLHLIYENIIKI